MLWHIAHDRLKTTSLLCGRQILQDPSCLLCGAIVEDTMHAIRDCTLPQQVWPLLLPAHLRTTFWTQMEPRSWILLNIDKVHRPTEGGKHWCYVFRQGLQELWYWRNLMLYQDQDPPDGFTLSKTILRKSLELMYTFAS